MATILVGGVLEKNGKILLVQEAKKMCRGKWNIPAGRLDQGETILDGAKREILEECGCVVELSGVLQIGNRVFRDDTWISVIFATKLVEDNIKFDKEEILDVKWFTYEEIINMKEELRDYDFIVNAINNYVNGCMGSIDIVQVFKS